MYNVYQHKGANIFQFFTSKSFNFIVFQLIHLNLKRKIKKKKINNSNGNFLYTKKF